MIDMVAEQGEVKVKRRKEETKAFFYDLILQYYDINKFKYVKNIYIFFKLKILNNFFLETQGLTYNIPFFMLCPVFSAPLEAASKQSTMI